MTEYVAFGLSWSLALTFVIFCILLAKKAFSKKLTVRFHYYIWLTLFVSVLAALLPKSEFYSQGASPQASQAPIGGAVSSSASSQLLFQDFAINSESSLPQSLCLILFGFWILGAAVMLLRIFYALIKTGRLYRSAHLPETDAELIASCMEALNIKRPVRIRKSPAVKSPVTIGVLRPCVLLPESYGTDGKYILLHELVHCKQKDPLFNFLLQIFHAVNWFNPAVWYAVRQIEQDREACCDSFVLDHLCPRERREYGHAVINWASGRFFPAVGMGSRKQQLHKRILQIAGYVPASGSRKRNSALLLVFLFLFAFILVPSAHGLSQSDYRPPASLNISYEDLGSYFNGYDGCFVLYNQKEDRYLIHNQTASTSRISPESTYKIYSGLAALESGKITAEDSYQEWDKTRYSFSEWNRNQTLNSAMKNSVNWYFQALDKSTGAKELQTFYDRIRYGNCDLSGGLSTYWMSSLKISPLEQVMLLTNFYENQWEFNSASVSAVKDALFLSEENGVRLSGKTGTGMKDGQIRNGWFIGYVETAEGLSVFALNLQGRENASGSKAAEIALQILRDKNLL